MKERNRTSKEPFSSEFLFFIFIYLFNIIIYKFLSSLFVTVCFKPIKLTIVDHGHDGARKVQDLETIHGLKWSLLVW